MKPLIKLSLLLIIVIFLSVFISLFFKSNFKTQTNLAELNQNTTLIYDTKNNSTHMSQNEEHLSLPNSPAKDNNPITFSKIKNTKVSDNFFREKRGLTKPPSIGNKFTNYISNHKPSELKLFSLISRKTKKSPSQETYSIAKLVNENKHTYDEIVEIVKTSKIDLLEKNILLKWLKKEFNIPTKTEEINEPHQQVIMNQIEPVSNANLPTKN